MECMSNNTHVQNMAEAIGNKVDNDVSTHNNSNTAHSDIRQDISNLNTRIGAAINYINR